MSKQKQSPPWLEQAIATMVRTGCRLEKAAADLNPPQHLSTVDCENLFRRADVCKMIRRFRQQFYDEVAREGRTKETAVGKLWVIADALLDTANYEKAANVIMQIAKIEQWINPDTVVQSWVPNPQELEEIRRRTVKELAARAAAPPASVN